MLENYYSFPWGFGAGEAEGELISACGCQGLHERHVKTAYHGRKLRPTWALLTSLWGIITETPELVRKEKPSTQKHRANHTMLY